MRSPGFAPRRDERRRIAAHRPIQIVVAKPDRALFDEDGRLARRVRRRGDQVVEVGAHVGRITGR